MKKRNQIFNYLYVIAIIMVIDDHVSTRIGLFSSIFPYNSFYMPLFVFCSGYFFKKSGIIENVVHKTKKLLIPYWIWNIIFYLLAFVIDVIFQTNWFEYPTFKSVFKSIFSKSLTSLNGAAWFIVMLFWVSIIYNILRNVIKLNKKNDIALTIILMLAGFLSIYLCTELYNTKSFLLLFILRTTFYIQFYHYGYIFREYLERKIVKLNKIVICSICIIINVILILKFGDKINFYATENMGNFSYWYLPLITSITGITFYYIVMEFLSRKIGQTKITDFIARNTFVILETHLLFINIPNLYVYYKILHGSTKYIDFDSNTFINDAFYRYSPNARLIGFFCGIIGSLLVAFLIEKVKEHGLDKLKTKVLRLKNEN